MFFTYFKYFSKFIIFAKSRQRLLLLAIAGLVLSSFSLIILQSTMGGLQNKLMERSKSVLGRAYITISKDANKNEVDSLIHVLEKNQIKYLIENEIELMIRYKSYLIPVIAHGIETTQFLPDFLDRGAIHAGVLPNEIAYKIELLPPDDIQLISPSHVDSLFTDIPRAQTVRIDKTFSTDVPEIDNYHIWVRLSLIQNLIHSHSINRLRIYSQFDFDKLKQTIPKEFRLKTWEEENSSLVWALNLESTMMIFLFASMSLLVSLCITSGLLIFFTKIKNDLASFWILGTSLKKINRSTTLFLHLMTLVSVITGLILGIVFLLVFVKLGPNIMPDVFVDRKIPVLITMKAICISALIPYSISCFFIHFSIEQFKREHNLLDHVRSIS